MSNELTKCRNCGAYINPELGADSPAEHAGNTGSIDNPRAPGDYDDICDECNYAPLDNPNRAE